jgi:hypothetical protein
VKWKNNSDCECGLGVNFQVKLPLDDGSRALSSGSVDESLVVNAGIPLWQASSLVLSTGATTTFKNKPFEDWPLYKFQYFFDFAFDFSLSEHWSFIFAGNMYSPFMKLETIEYIDGEPDPDIAAMNKVASGLNGLTQWRAHELWGARYAWGERRSKMILFYIQEDWGLGNINGSRGNLYINGAPDVAIGFKTQLSF